VGDPIGAGYPSLGLSYPSGFTSYSDTVNPGAPATTAFVAQGGAGTSTNIDKASGTWRTVFFSVDWVPIYNQNNANGRALLNTIITWFGGCGVTPTPTRTSTPSATPTATATPTPASIIFSLAPDLSDIAIALDVSGSGITDAESLADFIEAQGGSPPGSVQQLLKWEASGQTFLSWSHEFGFGDNVATETGDFIFLLLTASAPSSVTFTGPMPAPGAVQFALVPGQPAPACALNFISLPFDQAALTTADLLSDDIGGVLQALDWSVSFQNFLAWSNDPGPGGFGDNFATTPGHPYIVCLDNTAPTVWP
jgi:hypothetical protein